ncbi:hypothetical protein [Bradyrhizobium symbiodeficiens]|uniref:Uncharacterized protein n=1 Tax=Bradyrhizobium symbiodeficiens TaxID=1404367 RepID=A0AAJ6N4F1_9BRAD|nr:hypothetical protein [Bradyrhizobium symbiodeficiens]
MNGASIFDLSGKKVYDLRGNSIYRLSGELVGHTLGALGSDKHLDRDSEALLTVPGSPEPEEPETVLARQSQPSATFAEAIRLRRIISDTPSDRLKKR